MNTSPIRITLVDDSDLAVAGLRTLLAPYASRVELVDNRNGTLSIFGTIIDHAAPTSWGKRPKSPLELAALSRELGANDWQERAKGPHGQDGKRGRVEDRNVELLVPAPFKL